MKCFKFLWLYILLCGCEKFVTEKVEFKFVEQIAISERFDYPTVLINNKEHLLHIFSQEHKPLFRLRNFVISKDFDFNNSDYLLSFSKEVNNLSTTDDECDYLSKIPITVTYSEKDAEPYIYIYKILRKDKYRNLCPKAKYPTPPEPVTICLIIL